MSRRVSSAVTHPPPQRAESSPAAVAVDALRAALGDRLVAVVLFGSQARADSHAGSDWDLLVIAEGLPEKPFDRHLYLKRVLPPSCRSQVSLLAKTPAEFESRLPSLYLDLALDGRVLYDPHGYAAARMTILLSIIERSGLRRERTAAGDRWRWDRPPVLPWRLDWGV